MEQTRLQSKIENVLNDIKYIIQLCENKNYTNEQWYLDFEDKLNYYSVIDHTIGVK